RRIGERLGHQPHLPAIFPDAGPAAAFAADQGEDAGTPLEGNQDLEEGRREPLRRKPRGGGGEQPAPPADLRLADLRVASAGWAHRHFREHDGAAGLATAPEQTWCLARIRWQKDARWMQHAHASTRFRLADLNAEVLLQRAKSGAEDPVHELLALF